MYAASSSSPCATHAAASTRSASAFFLSSRATSAARLASARDSSCRPSCCATCARRTRPGADAAVVVGEAHEHAGLVPVREDRRGLEHVALEDGGARGHEQRRQRLDGRSRGEQVSAHARGDGRRLGAPQRRERAGRARVVAGDASGFARAPLDAAPHHGVREHEAGVAAPREARAGERVDELVERAGPSPPASATRRARATSGRLRARPPPTRRGRRRCRVRPRAPAPGAPSRRARRSPCARPTARAARRAARATRRPCATRARRR